MDWPLVLGLGLAVLAGGVVQSMVGFGMAVVAAPFVVLLAPDLMPVALLVPALALPLLQVALVSPRAIAALVGVLILLTVALSVRTIELRPTPVNAAAAGAVSGVSGTAAAIGGPFLALVLQHERPERVRSTLAVFFLAGSVLGLVGLRAGGQLTAQQVLVGGLWVPFVLLGYAAAVPLRARIDPDRFRRIVLGFCVVASVVVIGRAVLG